MTHTVTRRLAAEFLGTFWWVFGGCEAAGGRFAWRDVPGYVVT